MLGDIAFVRVLGPIQVVTTSGLALDLPSASQRRLLARLAVDAPRALRVDLLCDVLAVSPGALRTIVSRLRKGFGDTIVVASQGRYRLAAPVDAALFATLLSQLGRVTTGSGRSNGRWRCGQARRSRSSRPRTGPNPKSPGWLSCTRRRSRTTPSS
jgi:hypothetical protein